MSTRILLILTLCASFVHAADNPSPTPSAPPTEASIKQLLGVAQAHKLVDSVMMQMDNLMQQTIARRLATGARVAPFTMLHHLGDAREAGHPAYASHVPTIPFHAELEVLVRVKA